MPHDDWVRLWVWGAGVPAHLAMALVAARVLYWKDKAMREDGVLLAMASFFWEISATIYFVVWFIVHEPRKKDEKK